MKIDEYKLSEVIELLSIIKEYSYITYPNEDNKKASIILNKLFELTSEWKKIHDDNYSY